MESKFCEQIAVKNPKCITATTFSSKLNVYSSTSQASSLAFEMQMSNFGILD